ncbi:SDR family NAD(P)-dependent oxidoreductase [Aureimonas sp. AU22]|uniref:SDR family NAD(P)-dependent oxidoreductase n=1 Tax=Aureimonas sp. AU22 TaxID=1638162 RepID=UPI000784A394|nr:glucose 1-dehydrogenase [Aureimonas sp. AU22]
MYLERFKLTDRIAVVTGAAQGIGRATAEALAEAGAHVVVTDMNGTAAEDTADAIRQSGGSAEGMSLDVTRSDDVERVRQAILQKHGHVDILVNNAGIAISNRPAETMTDDVWLKVVDVNLNGLFWCCRAFGASMLERGSGNIVNVGSMSGFVVNRPQEQAQYNASKAGVHHLTKSLAAEWASRGVRVNAVAPTYIETSLTAYVYDDPELMKHWIGGTPMGRMGRTDEIASVILFLASEASSLMTGSIVAADGGYSCW